MRRGRRRQLVSGVLVCGREEGEMDGRHGWLCVSLRFSGRRPLSGGFVSLDNAARLGSRMELYVIEKEGNGVGATSNGTNARSIQRSHDQGQKEQLSKSRPFEWEQPW
jgi:hypothetical protein